MQDPFAIPVKVDPEMLQILGVEVVKLKTPLPDPPEALRVIELPFLREEGGEKLKGDCAVLPIVRFIEVVARRNDVSAAFVATKVQVPVAKPLTCVPDTEQIDGVEVEYEKAPTPDPPPTWKVPVELTDKLEGRLIKKTGA
jgi:hypothetical protein